MYRFDGFMVDPETWRLSRHGQEIHLEPVVLRLLIYLIEHRERLVTRQELMDTVWGDTVISESALTKAVARLRKALDDDSIAPRYLETVRSQGYRFVAVVEEFEGHGSAVSPTQIVHLRRRRQQIIAGSAAILAVMIAAIFWILASRNDTSRMEGIHSLAVLPLSNLTGDPEQDYYADGLQDLLVTELSQLPGIRVTSRQSTKRYRNSALTASDIASELGVDALVEGSLLREGDKVEVTIQLIDGQSDAHRWASRYTRQAPYVFNLIADIAGAIGDEIGAQRSSPGSRGLGRMLTGPVDPRAIDAYALGTMHLDTFTGDGIGSAIEQLETAVAIEPEFAMAWGQLGAAYAMQGMFGFAPPGESKQKLLAAASRAIEADSEVAIAHSSLGFARMYTGDFDSACESFAEALRLNPSATYAIHGEADCLLFEGRMDESIARLRELVAISPFSAMHGMPLPSHLYMARRFDDAVDAATAMQVRTPQFSTHWLIAKIYWEQGRFDEALEHERLEFKWRGDTVLLAALEEGLAAGGPNEAMHAIADALVSRASESHVDPFDIGETFARAGLVDEAIYWLEKAVEHGSYEMTYVAYWPHLDVVRSDPRYEDLMKRVYGNMVPKKAPSGG